MDILLTGGLNLNDPLTIGETELAIALNADFRKDGVVRSRDGRVILYNSVGTDLMAMISGSLYSFSTDIYKDGTSLGVTIGTPLSICPMVPYNMSTEAGYLATSTGYKRIEGTNVYNWGISAPTNAPTVSVGTSTGLTGDYKVVYTYARKVGGSLVAESNPSPQSSTITLSNQSLQVGVTPASDPQVTHIRIYRTVAGGSTFLYDREIPASSTGTETNTTDTSLGSAVEYDNDPPPSGVNVVASAFSYNRIFLGVANKLYFTKRHRPDSVPTTYYIEIGTPHYQIMGIIEWAGTVFVFTKEGIYYLQGDTPSSFTLVRTMATRGLYSTKGLVATDKGIMYVSYDGLYAFNGQVEVKLTDQKVDALFRGEAVNGVNPINISQLSNSWLSYYKGKLFFGYPDGANTKPNKVLVYDFEKKKFSIYDYNLSINSTLVDNENGRFLIGDTNNNIWHAETGTSDGGSAITFRVRSKELSNIEAIKPKWLRYDIYNPNNETITVKVLNQGSTIHSHTTTSNLDYKRRFIPQLAVERLSIELETNTTSRIEIGTLRIE